MAITQIKSSDIGRVPKWHVTYNVIINLAHIFSFKMVTYVQNKMIKFTIIVDISILGFNAHCMRTTR